MIAPRSLGQLSAPVNKGQFAVAIATPTPSQVSRAGGKFQNPDSITVIGDFSDGRCNFWILPRRYHWPVGREFHKYLENMYFIHQDNIWHRYCSLGLSSMFFKEY
jgi:hypothetical protein